MTGLRAVDIVRPSWLAHLNIYVIFSFMPLFCSFFIMLSLKMFVLFSNAMCERSARCIRLFALEFVFKFQVLGVIFILACFGG